MLWNDVEWDCVRALQEAVKRCLKGLGGCGMRHRHEIRLNRDLLGAFESEYSQRRGDPGGPLRRRQVVQSLAVLPVKQDERAAIRR